MEASEVIALVAVVVAGIGAVVTGISVWLNYRGSERRLEHEARMQEQKFAHERAEGVRETAAKAYVLSSEVARIYGAEEVVDVANSGSESMPLEAREKVVAAGGALDLVRALGWSADVRSAATNVSLTMSAVVHGADRLVSRYARTFGGGDELVEEFVEVWVEFMAARIAFQGAISE